MIDRNSFETYRSVFFFIFAFQMLNSPSLAQGNISARCERASASTGIKPIGMRPKFRQTQAINEDVKRAATEVVFRMENGSDPYVGITPNFDGEGISIGLIQFNMGGSIQETFAAVDRSVFQRWMPIYGNVLYAAVHSKPYTSKIVSLQLQHQVLNRSGKAVWRFLPEAGQELRAFLASPESRSAQDRGASAWFNVAVSQASSWAREARNASRPSSREITFFFDQKVFNGGSLGGMWVDQAKAFRSSFADDGAMVAFVSKWLASCGDVPSSQFLHGSEEGRANAAAWRASVPLGQRLPDEKALLFAHGFLRALNSNGPPEGDQHGVFKAQVASRRGTIALGIGTGNGVRWPGGILDD